jgi:hypothetical protein
LKPLQGIALDLKEVFISWTGKHEMNEVIPSATQMVAIDW